MGKKDVRVFTSCLVLSDVFTARLGPIVLHTYFILFIIYNDSSKCLSRSTFYGRIAVTSPEVATRPASLACFHFTIYCAKTF